MIRLKQTDTKKNTFSEQIVVLNEVKSIKNMYYM